MIDTATLEAAIAAHIDWHSPVHRCAPRCAADIRDILRENHDAVPAPTPDPLRDEPTGIGTDDDRFMARMVIRQGRLARERCVQGHTMEHRYSAHLGEWDACTRCGLIVVEEAAPTPDPLPVYCDVCPHAIYLHNPDGSCGCGVDCAALKEGDR